MRRWFVFPIQPTGKTSRTFLCTGSFPDRIWADAGYLGIEKHFSAKDISLT